MYPALAGFLLAAPIMMGLSWTMLRVVAWLDETFDLF